MAEKTCSRAAGPPVDEPITTAFGGRMAGRARVVDSRGDEEAGLAGREVASRAVRTVVDRIAEAGAAPLEDARSCLD